MWWCMSSNEANMQHPYRLWVLMSHTVIFASVLWRFDFKGIWFPGSSFMSSPSMLEDATNGSILRSSGELSIARTVAASSAVLGSVIDSAILSEISAELSADVAVWIGTEGFKAAEELRERLRSHVDAQAISELAQSAFHGLIDGGFTDGTGISQAVSAGASEVVAVLNSFSINQPEYVAQLFEGGTVVKPGVPKELFPVFRSPNASTVEASFKQFKTLQIAAGSAFLKVLAVGTIDAVTADNIFFGIKGGRDIKLHVINICSELSIGLFANFGHYSNLVEEIALTISDPANRDLVQAKLMPLFDGSFPRPRAISLIWAVWAWTLKDCSLWCCLCSNGILSRLKGLGQGWKRLRPQHAQSGLLCQLVAWLNSCCALRCYKHSLRRGFLGLIWEGHKDAAQGFSTGVNSTFQCCETMGAMWLAHYALAKQKQNMCWRSWGAAPRCIKYPKRLEFYMCYFLIGDFWCNFLPQSSSFHAGCWLRCASLKWADGKHCLRRWVDLAISGRGTAQQCKVSPFGSVDTFSPFPFLHLYNFSFLLSPCLKWSGCRHIFGVFLTFSILA